MPSDFIALNSTVKNKQKKGTVIKGFVARYNIIYVGNEIYSSATVLLRLRIIHPSQQELL